MRYIIPVTCKVGPYSINLIGKAEQVATYYTTPDGLAHVVGALDIISRLADGSRQSTY